MSKFKVGDRVRILHTDYNGAGLDAGTIHDVCDSCNNGVELMSCGEHDSGQLLYFRDDELEPIPTRTLTVGETYTSVNGNKWICIAVDGDLAWMRADHTPTSPAYTFKTDGTNISQGGGHWDIKFEPVVEWVERPLNYDRDACADECVYTGHHDDGHNLNLRFPLIDGKPDWSQATVTEA